MKLLSLLFAVSLIAAACGDDATDDAAVETDDTTADTIAEDTTEDTMEEDTMEEAGTEDTMEEDTTEDTMEEDTMEEAGTIVDVATEAGQFTTLLAAAEAAGLVDTLNGPGPITVFAPTDDAFAAALDSLGITAEDLLADTDMLTSILTYHVVEGAVMSTDLADGDVPTVNGANITVDLTDGVMINDANVVTADIEASNGVIHVIDSVLLPPTE